MQIGFVSGPSTIYLKPSVSVSTKPVSLSQETYTIHAIMPPIRSSEIKTLDVKPTLYAVIASEDNFAEENISKKRRKGRKK